MKTSTNAVEIKKARTCDSCSKRRARWFCAADDAFLCQSCDGSIHSANPLARRHERIRLKSAASPAAVKHSSHSASPSLQEAAAWHQGFTRKPRTPRGSGKNNRRSISHGLVPEISVEDQTDSHDEVEEKMICQVPVLDPMMANHLVNDVVEPMVEFPLLRSDNHEEESAESCLRGLFTTDMELEEYIADVETLLGRGSDTEDLGLSSFDMFKIKKDDIIDDEKEETKAMNMVIRDENGAREGTIPFELSFDHESKKTYQQEVIKNVEKTSGNESIKVKKEEQKNAPMLRLNYNSVISAWGGQGLPWTSGEPPELDIDISDSPVVAMGGNKRESYQRRGVGCLSSGVGDKGREASVLRYKEKRRKRLFSKKIRYEVRKLNAEKRPRMKGRFVKRASLAVSAAN